MQIVERLLEINRLFKVAKLESVMIEQYGKDSDFVMKKIGMKWMDISESLIEFLLRNDDEKFNQLKGDLSSLICVLPRNACSVILGKMQEEDAMMLNEKMMKISKIEDNDPIDAREQYLRIIEQEFKKSNREAKYV